MRNGLIWLMAVGCSVWAQAQIEPVAIRVPEGNVEFLRARAEGTQNYVCVGSGAGYAWKFVGPQATLLQGEGGGAKQVLTHFLSPNPGENGMSRATWQSSTDSSAVWGKPMGSGESAKAKSIPWLLLQVAGARGGGLLAQTAFIQRIETDGGVMPASGCSGEKESGTLVQVPYTAVYVFYRKR